MSEMPNLPDVPCCQGLSAVQCECSPSERALRAWGWDSFTEPMTDDQREWCRDEVGRVEGYDRHDYDGMGDAAMARGVMSAWADFARDKGLL